VRESGRVTCALVFRDGGGPRITGFAEVWIFITPGPLALRIFLTLGTEELVSFTDASLCMFLALIPNESSRPQIGHELLCDPEPGLVRVKTNPIQRTLSSQDHLSLQQQARRPMEAQHDAILFIPSLVGIVDIKA
jgi:hypothetical protein